MVSKKYLFLEESNLHLQSGCKNLCLQPQSEPFGQPQILLERSSLAVFSGVPSLANTFRLRRNKIAYENIRTV
ncbi:MAG: hypothetical protein HFH69_11590 [Lachnospiraceae bacterium]|nr:hypothetical protein [Lachnospiraceae bacterium]